MNKIKLFENSSITRLNKEIDDFLESENANVVNVKLAINQSTYKPSYSHFVIALVYNVSAYIPE